MDRNEFRSPITTISPILRSEGAQLIMPADQRSASAISDAPMQRDAPHGIEKHSPGTSAAGNHHCTGEASLGSTRIQTPLNLPLSDSLPRPADEQGNRSGKARFRKFSQVMAMSYRLTASTIAAVFARPNRQFSVTELTMSGVLPSLGLLSIIRDASMLPQFVGNHLAVLCVCRLLIQYCSLRNSDARQTPSAAAEKAMQREPSNRNGQRRNHMNGISAITATVDGRPSGRHFTQLMMQTSNTTKAR